LFSGVAKSATMAADYSQEQDMMAFPWGGNHVTNRYFESSQFGLRTVSDDVSRTEKVGVLGKNKFALASVSFCKRRDLRPMNCGKCGKCLRTKAMFAATVGEQPDIFLDQSFSREDLYAIDLSDKKEIAFFSDLFLHARASGNLDKVPGLAERYQN